MTAAIQSTPKELSYLVIISDTPPIIETETDKYIVLNKYIHGVNVKTQVDINRIVYSNRFCLCDGANMPTFHIPKDWFQKFKTSGITKIVYQENGKFTSLKGQYSIVQMNQAFEDSLQKLKKSEGMKKAG